MTPTDIEQSRLELDRQVAARKLRGAAGTIERITGANDVENLASVMPEVIASFERMEIAARAFREEIRPQFDAAPDTEPCQWHPEIPLARDFDATANATREAGSFVLMRARCPECAAEARAADEARYWSRRGVPGRLIEATLGNFLTDGMVAKEKAKHAVYEWLRKRQVFLILIGTAGTGKGHLAVGCLKHEGDGLFITQIDMLSDLRASYTLNTTPAVIEKWRETPMFVLDELGLSAGGKDEEPLLYQVLAYRHDQRKPTIVTSNKTVYEVKELLGYRLIDRVRESCAVVPMAWLSHRSGR